MRLDECVKTGFGNDTVRNNRIILLFLRKNLSLLGLRRTKKRSTNNAVQFFVGKEQSVLTAGRCWKWIRNLLFLRELNLIVKSEKTKWSFLDKKKRNEEREQIISTFTLFNTCKQQEREKEGKEEECRKREWGRERKRNKFFHPPSFRVHLSLMNIQKRKSLAQKNRSVLYLILDDRIGLYRCLLTPKAAHSKVRPAVLFFFDGKKK